MMLASFAEMCPHCGYENDSEDYDVTNGCFIRCKNCGELIKLCDVCMHSADNTEQYCDWHIKRQNNKYYVGECFRGVTFNRKSED